MNIAVYSGSFNPLHIGHLAIMKHLVEEAGFDMVYLIVSPKNPLKDSISSDSARDRYNAALAAVTRHFGPLGDRGGQTVATRGHVSGCHDRQGVTGWRADDQREEESQILRYAQNDTLKIYKMRSYSFSIFKSERK